MTDMMYEAFFVKLEQCIFNNLCKRTSTRSVIKKSSFGKHKKNIIKNKYTNHYKL